MADLLTRDELRVIAEVPLVDDVPRLLAHIRELEERLRTAAASHGCSRDCAAMRWRPGTDPEVKAIRDRFPGGAVDGPAFVEILKLQPDCTCWRAGFAPPRAS